MPVYVSQNNVALTEGRDGSLPNKYIYRVCVLVRGQAVEVEARAGELPDPQSVDAVWQHLGSRQSAPRRPRSAAARKRWRPALPTQFAVSAHAGLVSILTCPLSPQPALISQDPEAHSGSPSQIGPAASPDTTVSSPSGQWQVLYRIYNRRASRRLKHRRSPWMQFHCLAPFRLFAQSPCPMLSLQFFPRCIDLTEGPVSTTALMAPGDAQQENWRSVQRGLRREQRKMLSGSSCPGSSANLGRSRARHQSASSSGAGLLFVECSGQYADRGHFGGAAIRCGPFRPLH